MTPQIFDLVGGTYAVAKRSWDRLRWKERAQTGFLQNLFYNQNLKLIKSAGLGAFDAPQEYAGDFPPKSLTPLKNFHKRVFCRAGLAPADFPKSCSPHNKFFCPVLFPPFSKVFEEGEKLFTKSFSHRFSRPSPQKVSPMVFGAKRKSSRISDCFSVSATTYLPKTLRSKYCRHNEA